MREAYTLRDRTIFCSGTFGLEVYLNDGDARSVKEIVIKGVASAKVGKTYVLEQDADLRAKVAAMLEPHGLLFGDSFLNLRNGMYDLHFRR